MPGVEILDKQTDPLDEAVDDAEAIPASARRPEKWRLRVESDSRRVELSPRGVTARSFWATQTGASLKLEGLPSTTHDEALSVLETYGNGYLFELDVLYGVSAVIQRQRARVRRPLTAPSQSEPKFPRNKYAQEALALYQYARTAAGLPLLEYLAYYQSLEFFFPVFAREQTLRSLRIALMNPKFDPTDDGAVGRLINLSAPAVKAGLGVLPRDVG